MPSREALVILGTVVVGGVALLVTGIATGHGWLIVAGGVVLGIVATGIGVLALAFSGMR